MFATRLTKREPEIETQPHKFSKEYSRADYSMNNDDD